MPAGASTTSESLACAQSPPTDWISKPKKKEINKELDSVLTGI